MNSLTWIEISRSNLNHNILQYKQWLPEHTGIAPVIKANAYGHGLYHIASIHEKNPYVTRLCVVNTQEALFLRKHGIKKPILVLGYINSSLEDIILHDIDITVSDKTTINLLETAAQQLKKQVNIHLKVDTGMSRFGIYPQEVTNYIQHIQNCSNLILQGIWSHLHSGNKKEVVHQQEELFKTCHQKNIQIHIANSLGSLHSKYHYDFVRIGLGLYGYLLTPDKEKQKLLKPVLSLKTKIVFIKNVQKDKNIGYRYINRYTTNQPMKIAVLSMGYYDGLNSQLAQKGRVIIKGHYAPIISINMNVTTVDITDIPECKIDDTVTVLGEEGDKIISAYEWQRFLKKNIRECLVKLESSLPRVIVNDPLQPVSFNKLDYQKLEL